MSEQERAQYWLTGQLADGCFHALLVLIARALLDGIKPSVLFLAGAALNVIVAESEGHCYWLLEEIE